MSTPDTCIATLRHCRHCWFKKSTIWLRLNHILHCECVCIHAWILICLLSPVIAWLPLSAVAQMKSDTDESLLFPTILFLHTEPRSFSIKSHPPAEPKHPQLPQGLLGNVGNWHKWTLRLFSWMDDEALFLPPSVLIRRAAHPPVPALFQSLLSWAKGHSGEAWSLSAIVGLRHCASSHPVGSRRDVWSESWESFCGWVSAIFLFPPRPWAGTLRYRSDWDVDALSILFGQDKVLPNR